MADFREIETRFVEMLSQSLDLAGWLEGKYSLHYPVLVEPASTSAGKPALLRVLKGSCEKMRRQEDGFLGQARVGAVAAKRVKLAALTFQARLH